MKRLVLAAAGLVIAFWGIGRVSRDADAACNNQCRYRNSHCYNPNSEWRCWYWVDSYDCYYCVGGSDMCQKNNDAFVGPCTSVVGTTNHYQIYDECDLICALNPGAHAEGTCSGFVLESDSTPRHACTETPEADTVTP
jgi:hypothetical protein